MTDYYVEPDGDGWKVTTAGGRRVYKKIYQRKRAAMQAARRAADRGDSVQARRTDGTYGEEHTKGVFGPAGDSG